MPSIAERHVSRAAPRSRRARTAARQSVGADADVASFDGGGFGGQVDARRAHARHARQRLLDAADARGAGHAFDRQ